MVAAFSRFKTFPVVAYKVAKVVVSAAVSVVDTVVTSERETVVVLRRISNVPKPAKGCTYVRDVADGSVLVRS